MQTALVGQWTTGVNTSFDTGSLFPNGIDVSMFDGLLVQLSIAGTNVAFNYYVYGKDGNNAGKNIGQSQIGAGQVNVGLAIGPGCSYAYGTGMVGIPAPLPGRFNIAFDAPGAGANFVLTIWGTRIGR